MNRNTFKMAALAASIALAMSATPAMAAAPTATQLPGKGKLVTTGTVDIANSGVDTTTNTLTVALLGTTVIDWGKGTGTEGNNNINSTGVAGFNIGSGAHVTFSGNSGVLNIDSSGNPSQIMGTLTTEGDNGNVFVANKNGIIVGKGASISSDGQVGLIANNLGDTGSFNGTGSSIVYNGTGGDVTVEAGADISGSSVLVSGGGNVNVNLSGILGDEIILIAGLHSEDADLAITNDAAKLTVTGDGELYALESAGDASSSGELTVNEGDVAGTFTNTGALTLNNGVDFSGALVNEKTVTANGFVTLGGLTNDGEFNADSWLAVNGDLVNNGTIGSDENYGYLTVVDGSLVNKGMVTADGVSVTGGDLTNDGTISGNGENLVVTNGSIVNSGKLLGFGEISTQSNDDSVADADYSISNVGTMEVSSDVWANAYEDGGQYDTGTTGSFTNTGTLQFSPGEYGTALQVYVHDDVNLGGTVQVKKSPSGNYAAVSASNPLANFDLEGNGTVTVATPLAFDAQNDGSPSWGHGSYIEGGKVKVLADLTGVGESYTSVWIDAGDKVADDYAIRIANGVTVSADQVGLEGYNDTDHPNVILQGTVAGNEIYLGGYEGGIAYAVSDVFSGPNGGLVATGDEPGISVAFTGGVKTAPYLNDANFRYNGLPITVADADSVALYLNPVAYQTNGTSNGLSGVNLLVNGNAELDGMDTPDEVWDVLDTGSAVTGLNSWENTHLVLQSTGSIDVGTNGDFYWPGYVYLGNIATNDDGSAAPGTLGLGSIALYNDFTNVLPGSMDNGGGIHFISQFPLQAVAQDNFCFNGCGDQSIQVTTNGGSWVNFASDMLTQGYATGALGGISFEGGVQGPGNVVNYGKLDASMFHTHAPDANR